VSDPFVSIVTPVYNGAKYLRDCIEGVLKQTYPNFEYVILDNASTDGTAEIIADYASRDSRIRTFRNPETLKIIDNWNESLTHIAAEAKWVKFAFADDILFPHCVADMVAIGESNEKIGLVSAYHLNGRTVANVGLPMHQTIADGRDMLKAHLLRRIHVCLDSPNTVLYRRGVLDQLNGFDNHYLHADTELALRILNRNSLGFVHQVLTWTGVNEDRGASFAFYHGIITKEYLDFAYHNIARYEEISLNADEKREMDAHYAHEFLLYLSRHLVYFLWKDFKAIWEVMPRGVKRQLLPSLRRHWFVYLRRFSGSILHYRTRKKPSFAK
jgi:glycosyltransferase involved in cell wall biosynthesis